MLPEVMARRVFPGHHSKNVEPRNWRTGTRPTRVRVAAARRMVVELLTSGMSCHSDRGSTLWVVETAAKELKLKINVEHKPGVGYVVRLPPTVIAG